MAGASGENVRKVQGNLTAVSQGGSGGLVVAVVGVPMESNTTGEVEEVVVIIWLVGRLMVEAWGRLEV